jgi:hypothetical protein
MGWEDIDWIYLAENRYGQWVLVSEVSVSMKVGKFTYIDDARSHTNQVGKFIGLFRSFSFLTRNLLHRNNCYLACT